MKHIHEFDISPKVIEGKVGSVEAYDIIDEKILAGVRIVKPNCDVPKELLPGGGKRHYQKCPFIVKNNNPCYSDYCGDVNWDKKGGYHIGMNKKCKHIVSNYCELYSDIDDSCLCWRKEYRNLPSCRKFRRKYQDPKDYQCNIKDFDIEEHPSFNKYIKKDKIPCWNCKIPN